MEPLLGDGMGDAELVGVEHEAAWMAFLLVGVGVDGVC